MYNKLFVCTVFVMEILSSSLDETHSKMIVRPMILAPVINLGL